MNDDSSVPNASCRMPNLGWAASGFHAFEVRKPALSAFSAGMAFAMRNTAIAAMMRSSRMLEPRAEAPNSRSPRRPVPSLRPGPLRPPLAPCSRVSVVTRCTPRRSDWEAGTPPSRRGGSAPAQRRSRSGQALNGRLYLGQDGGRQRGVPQAAQDRLTLLAGGVGEEGLHELRLLARQS